VNPITAAIVTAPDEWRYADKTMRRGNPGKMRTTLVKVEKEVFSNLPPKDGKTPNKRESAVAMMPTAKPTPREFRLPQISWDKISWPWRVVPKRCVQLGG
jgi:hypothetical protein